MKDVNEETIISFLQGKLPVKRTHLLLEWIEASNENRNYFEELRNLWLATSTQFSESDFNAEIGWEKVKNGLHQPSVRELYQVRKRSKYWNRKFIRMTAVFFLIFTLGAVLSWYVNYNSNVVSMGQKMEIRAPQGSRSQVTLPDGSKVWLNAGTVILYNKDFNKSERIIDLRGEAYFNITSNKKKPFIVHTSHLEVKAFGTIFNVKAYPEEDEIVTTLVEGDIIVESKVQSPLKFTYRLKPEENITYFKSVKKVEYSKERDTESSEEATDTSKPEKAEKIVKVEKVVKTELFTSWKDENWVIEGVTMVDLARMLERRYNTDIEFASDAIKKYKFTGKIQKETLEQVLEILRMTIPVKYEVGKGWVKWDLDPELEQKYKELLNNED